MSFVLAAYIQVGSSFQTSLLNGKRVNPTIQRLVRKINHSQAVAIGELSWAPAFFVVGFIISLIRSQQIEFSGQDKLRSSFYPELIALKLKDGFS